uniref:Uncharacterized protein n=1 Tax=Cacopsylla melanoneura TaxID=428564 RepID=A0A8D9AK02_9HEMI
MTLELMSPIFQTPCEECHLLDLILFHPVYCTTCTLALALQSSSIDTELSLYKLNGTIWNKLDTIVLGLKNNFIMALHTTHDRKFVSVAEFISTEPSLEAGVTQLLYEITIGEKLVFVKEFSTGGDSSTINLLITWHYEQDSYLAISRQSDGAVTNHDAFNKGIDEEITHERETRDDQDKVEQILATVDEEQNSFNENETEKADDNLPDNEDVNTKTIMKENQDNTRENHNKDANAKKIEENQDKIRRGDLEIKESDEDYENETEDIELKEEIKDETRSWIEIYVKSDGEWELFGVLTLLRPVVTCMLTFLTADDNLYLGIVTRSSNMSTTSSTLYRFDFKQNQFLFHQMLNSQNAIEMKHMRWSQGEDLLIVSERDVSQNIVTSMIYKYTDGIFVPLQHIVSMDTQYLSWLLYVPTTLGLNQGSPLLLLAAHVNNKLGLSVYQYGTHGPLFKQQTSTVWFHETFSSEIRSIRAVDVNGLVVLTLTYKDSNSVSSVPNMFVFRYTSHNDQLSLLNKEINQMMSEIEQCDPNVLKRKIENGVERNETRVHFSVPVILYNADVQYVYTEELFSKESSVNMYIDLAVQDLEHFLLNVDEEIQTITSLISGTKYIFDDVTVPHLALQCEHGCSFTNLTLTSLNSQPMDTLLGNTINKQTGIHRSNASLFFTNLALQEHFLFDNINECSLRDMMAWQNRTYDVYAVDGGVTFEKNVTLLVQADVGLVEEWAMVPYGDANEDPNHTVGQFDYDKMSPQTNLHLVYSMDYVDYPPVHVNYYYYDSQSNNGEWQIVPIINHIYSDFDYDLDYD